MEIKLNVTLEASEKLVSLLGSLLELKGTKTEGSPAPKPEHTASLEAVTKEAPMSEAETLELMEKRWQEEVKEAMDFRFRALIGEDWQNAQGLELTQKRAITQWFRTIANELGAPESKPTRVPVQNRNEFLERIKNITKKSDGKIDYLPF